MSLAQGSEPEALAERMPLRQTLTVQSLTLPRLLPSQEPWPLAWGLNPLLRAEGPNPTGSTHHDLSWPLTMAPTSLGATGARTRGLPPEATA